jgi:hypothetical protein
MPFAKSAKATPTHFGALPGALGDPSMNVTWGTFTRTDGSSYRQIVVSNTSSTDLFQSVAGLLSSHVPGKWTARMTGLDQAYWDYESDGGKITLHLEHYMGISIYPTAGADADPSSLRLLEEAYRVLDCSHA